MEVDPNGTVVLTAKVKNACGTAVVGREVTFGFAVQCRAARRSTPPSVNTDCRRRGHDPLHGGDDLADLTSSAPPSPTARRWMRTSPSCPNSHPPNGERQVSLTASPTSLAAGQHSILTATVTDGDSETCQRRGRCFFVCRRGAERRNLHRLERWDHGCQRPCLGGLHGRRGQPHP